MHAGIVFTQAYMYARARVARILAYHMNACMRSCLAYASMSFACMHALVLSVS